MSALATIRVTADHIARGKRSDPFGCPIALAVCEQGGYIPGDVAVNVTQIELPFGPWDITGELPERATAFINQFDDDEPVEPFEFTAEWFTEDGTQVTP